LPIQEEPPLVADATSKDVIVFQFIDNDVNLLKTRYMVQVYKTETLIVATQRWAQYGLDYLEQKYLFSNGRDTMKVSCGCGQQRHLFLKNLHFEKGQFNLEVKIPMEAQIEGKGIASDDKLNALLLKNVWDQISYPRILEDVPFEKMRFHLIDLKNTTDNVMKKVD
jgi:hypothetical protein